MKNTLPPTDRFREVWPWLVALSAMAMTSSLSNAHLTTANYWERTLLSFAAWGVFMIAFRPVLPRTLARLRSGWRAFGNYKLSVGVAVTLIMAVGTVLSCLFAWRSISMLTDERISRREWQGRQEIRLHQYQTLEAAIKSRNLKLVRHALMDYGSLDQTAVVRYDTTGGEGEDVFKELPEKPLTTAIRTGDLRIVQLLLARGAAVAPANALVTAVDHGGVPMMRLMIYRGGTDSGQISQINAALWRAVAVGNADGVAYLLKNHADPNYQDCCPTDQNQIWSVLQLAQHKDSVRVVQMLLSAGAQL